MLGSLPCWLSAIVFVLVTQLSSAATLDVRVLDRNGEPVSGVAVYVLRPGLPQRSPPDAAIMDQVDKRFVPHMLVIQAGTEVQFPNSDTVAHHVYSFSHPNHFKLQMYKGNAHPPVLFEHSGLVTLGCNIHDNMLGFILVVATDTFAMTDAAGHAMLDVESPGDAEVRIWSPRFRDDEDLLSRDVELGHGDTSLEFVLGKSLRPPHDAESESISWTDY